MDDIKVGDIVYRQDTHFVGAPYPFGIGVVTAIGPHWWLRRYEVYWPKVNRRRLYNGECIAKVEDEGE